MRLSAPTKAPLIYLHDVEGNLIKVGSGRPTLLAFFRDAACPFCNMQLFQLVKRHARLSSMGLDIIAVFASSPHDVRRFVLAKHRPFPVAAEPDAEAYEIYGLNQSFSRKLQAVALRFPTLLAGLAVMGWKGALYGMAGVNTNNFLPADFLIDETGNIVHAHYGRDAGDHIGFETVEAFLADYMLRIRKSRQITRISAKRALLNHAAKPSSC